MDGNNVFAKLYRPVYQDPIWNGKVPGQAWRVYCWMIDRTTREQQTKAGTIGRVFNRAPVTYLEIAEDLGCSWRSIQRAVAWLRKKKLIIATRAGREQEYRYEIPNSCEFGDSNRPETVPDKAQGNSFEDEEDFGNPQPGVKVHDLEG